MEIVLKVELSKQTSNEGEPLLAGSLADSGADLVAEATPEPFPRDPSDLVALETASETAAASEADSEEALMVADLVVAAAAAAAEASEATLVALEATEMASARRPVHHLARDSTGATATAVSPTPASIREALDASTTEEAASETPADLATAMVVVAQAATWNLSHPAERVGIATETATARGTGIGRVTAAVTGTEVGIVGTTTVHETTTVGSDRTMEQGMMSPAKRLDTKPPRWDMCRAAARALFSRYDSTSM